ncbi:MAG: GAF domain-containing protein, partial [Spirochaetia bacterium]|nr:GAF domain-containing protein [Spirochaetia bacterium]
ADREEIEYFIKLISPSIYQSLQKKELENQKKSIEELNKFIKNLNESHDFEKILEKTKSYINQFFNIEHYSIGFTDKEKKYVKILSTSFAISKNVKEELKELKVPITDIVSAHTYAYKAKKPFYIKNVRSNRVSKEEKIIIEILKFKSVLIIPLILDGNLIGFLDLFNDKKELNLTKEQINQLSILAEQLAGIIYSSNLYQELETQKKKIEDAYSVLQSTKNELEAEKSQMERIQFMSQEIQKKTNFREILLSLEEIIWSTYKISEYILAIKDIEINEYRCFSLCQHWEKNGLNERLRNVSISEKNSIYHLVFNKNLEVLFEGIDTDVFKKLNSPADFISP